MVGLDWNGHLWGRSIRWEVAAPACIGTYAPATVTTEAISSSTIRSVPASSCLPSGAIEVLDHARLRVLRATAVIALLIASTNLAGSVLRSSPADPEGLATALALAWCLVWALVAGLPRASARFLFNWRLAAVMLAIANGLTVALTGGIDSPDLAVCMYGGWVSAVVVSARPALVVSVAICGSILTGYLLAGASLAEVLTGPQRYNAVMSAVLPLLTGLVGVLLAAVANRVFSQMAETLHELRHGGQATTPAMTAVLAGHTINALTAAPPKRDTARTAFSSASLTEAELEVVALLANGRRPKQIAVLRGVALSTVRSQIKAAKKKTGAATIEELIARTWDAGT